MYIDEEYEEFLKWCRKNNKFKKENRDIYVNDNGNYKIEKREVEVLDSSLELIKEYEKDIHKKVNKSFVIAFT